MSRHYMNLLKKQENVVRAVQQHSRVRLIFLKYNNPVVKENVGKLIEILVEIEFAKTNTRGKTSADADSEHKISMMEKRLQPPLEGRDIQAIHEWTTRIAKASIGLSIEKAGIGYSVDPILETDKHVFSILGPHLGHYYGDIVITFKQEIMFHPDANFTIQAGTSFFSGNIYRHRQWMRDSGSEAKRTEHFHHSKLHCSVPRYEYATALELVASAGFEHQSMDVNLETILENWISVDSHRTLEGHLPQLIPLDYVDRVCIPKNTFESLLPEAQQSAKGAFKDSLVITVYESDSLDIEIAPKQALTYPYSKYVFEELCEAIKQRMDRPHISRGIVITVGASDFAEHIVLPISISQAQFLYYLDNPQSPDGPEFIYIYWQAMDGDLMLTLTNEKIEPGGEQFNLKCLICYIAQKPSTVTEEFHETFTYLNDDLPYQHGNNVNAVRLEAKSNTFYRGCNTDDYFTFCLKLNYRTGHVILSHAGPNSIYNHEKIEYKFDRAELDLSKLDYIHLSAGTQDVPVRNLTINLEPIAELHPIVDAQFKRDTSNLLERYLVATSHNNPAPPITNRARKQRPLAINPRSNINNSVILGRIADIICCRHTNAIEPMALDDARPALTPCRDSIYCLQQNSSKHTKQFSHPCPYSELCKRKVKESHLTHERHNVLKCSKDKYCLEKNNPIHRANYRHTSLPDYLILCRKQSNCQDTSLKHRIKYFHGETLPLIKSKSMCH
ncbi:unnamed protein product [Rotaria magnacalcarata]|uniref:Uncharacterized protein n=1 Tax=Rotaria magnacalcarata TaxID=392030 RepID=A0A816GJP6_9BILA|nr:unnamed protein product [Rotaria magnacalcarata]